jgi:hypothetical protein
MSSCPTILLADVDALVGPRGPHEAPRTDALLDSLAWYETSRTIAQRAGRLRFDWARQGVTLSLSDLIIAATALEHGLTSITGNRKHFPMSELSLHPLPDRMSTATKIVPAVTGLSAPALIAAAGDHASEKFFEFFTAQIGNRNTRGAYLQAAHQFLPGAKSAASRCTRSGRCMWPPTSKPSSVN